jgi:hypothetical protein
MFKKAFYLVFVLLMAVGIQSAVSQITISPIMLFMDQQQRFGTFMVMNGSQQAQEVSIEFPFGYPVTDKQGNIQMVYNDSTVAQKWGISDAIKGFPKNFTLQPGQRQVVRLTVRPRDFQDGMYWSRIRTTSTPVSTPVGEEEEDEISTQITYKFEQVTTVFYKHGEVNTGIEINNITTSNSEGEIEVAADLSRTGNAPFLGSIQLTIKDQQGNTIVEKSISTSIYFDYRQVFNIQRDQLGTGEYTAELRIISQRGDISNSDIVQMEPVTETTNIALR